MVHILNKQRQNINGRLKQEGKLVIQTDEGFVAGKGKDNIYNLLEAWMWFMRLRGVFIIGYYSIIT